MTLNLLLLYFVWTEKYCQTSPNKNKSQNLWHVTSILVCCIFGLRSLEIVLVDLFIGGSETTATSINWTILYLLHYPHVQDKIHEELDQIVGKSRLVKKKLPLLTLFILLIFVCILLLINIWNVLQFNEDM